MHSVNPINSVRYPQRSLAGLFERRERWSLTRRGWFGVALILAGLITSLFFSIYPFLSLTKRADADVLVVEGWAHEYAIRAAVEEFHSRPYRFVCSTGGPVSGSGGYINDFNTSAGVGAGLLIKCGLSRDLVHMVPSHVNNRDRTYSSALALRQWLQQNKLAVRSINVITEDLHARRSRLLFQKALGDDVTVGIISVPTVDYDAKHWWRYSQGLEDVLKEGFAYLYARFLFHPDH